MWESTLCNTLIVFFFQAEDGIRDTSVTGVQTCALPICCAGGAGTFIVKDYDTSQKIFERKRAAIRDSGAQVVATACPAGMIELKNGLRGDVDVRHIAQLLEDAYGDEPLRMQGRTSSRTSGD